MSEGALPLGVLLIGVGFLWGPLALEGTNNSCPALDRRLTQYILDAMDPAERAKMTDLPPTLAEIDKGLGSPNGEMSEKRMGIFYPSLPNFASCPIGYWRMVINRFGFMSEMKASEKHS